MGTLVTSETQVNSYVTSTQAAADVAVLADGGHVVVWQSAGQDGHAYGVYGQRYDAGGVRVGGEFLVNTMTGGYQYEPSITSMVDGGFLVTWQDNGQDGSGHGIYAQRYNAAGVKVGGETLINQTTAGEQIAPAVTGLSGGGYVVVFENYSSGEIVSRLFGADGLPRGGDFTWVNVTTAGRQNVPAVSALPGGGYVAVWQTDTNGVRARIFNADGAAATGEFQVHVQSGVYHVQPSVATLADGSFVVAWRSSSSVDTLMTRRFAADGLALSGEVSIGTAPVSYRTQPDISALADGGYVVSWQSANQDGNAEGVYGQRYDAAGIKVGSEFRISETVALGQQRPAVAGRADGGFVVAWDSDGQDGSGQGVYSRVYAPASAAPVLSLADGKVVAGGAVALPELTVGTLAATGTAPGGKPLVAGYQFTDQTADGGYFMVGGKAQLSGTTFTVAADKLATVQWVGGSAPGTDTISVQALDGAGNAWGAASP